MKTGTSGRVQISSPNRDNEYVIRLCFHLFPAGQIRSAQYLIVSFCAHVPAPGPAPPSHLVPGNISSPFTARPSALPATCESPVGPAPEKRNSLQIACFRPSAIASVSARARPAKPTRPSEPTASAMLPVCLRHIPAVAPPAHPPCAPSAHLSSFQFQLVSSTSFSNASLNPDLPGLIQIFSISLARPYLS